MTSGEKSQAGHGEQPEADAPTSTIVGEHESNDSAASAASPTSKSEDGSNGEPDNPEAAILDGRSADTSAEGKFPGSSNTSILRTFPILLLAALAGAAVTLAIDRAIAPPQVERAADPQSADMRADLDALTQDLDSNRQRLQSVQDELESLKQRLGERPDENLSGVNQRLAELESTLAELAQLRPTSGTSEDATRLADEIESLRSELATLTEAFDSRLTSLEERSSSPNFADRLSSFAEESDVEDLARRIAALEENGAQEAARRASLALALANLTRAAAAGEPFAIELDVVSALAPGRPQIARLRAAAGQGIATQDELRRSFAEVLNAALRAERVAEADTWRDRIWASMRSLVSVRRLGDVSGTEPQDVLVRAEAHLAAGDLEAAAKELHTLQGPAAEVVAPWLMRLDAKNDADDLVASLTSDILLELASDTAGPS